MKRGPQPFGREPQGGARASDPWSLVTRGLSAHHLSHQGECLGLEWFRTDERAAELGLPAARSADVVEVLAGGLNQPVRRVSDAGCGRGTQDVAQCLAGLLDIARHAVRDQALGRYRDELGNEPLAVPWRNPDVEQLPGQL